jgi:hypothetical protein
VAQNILHNFLNLFSQIRKLIKFTGFSNMHDSRKCFKISKNAPVFAKLHEFKSEQIILKK